MANAFDDQSLGLILKGYHLVPNDALETKIAIYTPDIVQSVLAEHPQIIDRWLQKLHNEYINNKRSCDFENDPVACFNLSAYEDFERHFKSWEDGGMIAIFLPNDRIIRLSKKPLISMVNEKAGYLICIKCSRSFSDLNEFDKHQRQENNVNPPPEKKGKTGISKDDNVPLNPIWWLTP
ncbi:MAG: hypothetical protein M3247_09235 [Thermoproteota archaeon]|nr:hypothetical protein [Thermoproteota archaeon]